ncbi:MAG: hypothetical protein GY715_02305 [Planctomycetes bacterium]|nr:hypothetical protein [Planctomycetota bacterium]
MPTNGSSSTTRHHQGAATGLLLGILVALAGTGCASSGKKATTDRTDYTFWPQFPDEPRLQFLTSYRFSEDVEPPKGSLDAIIYGKGKRVLPITKPYGLEMSNGRIYVCDTKNAGVVVLDLRKRETRLMGVSGTGRLTSPTDIAIARDGTMYVSDAQRGVVGVYDANERNIATFGFPGFKPTGVAVSGDELFVCDFASKKVQVLDRYKGTQLREIGFDSDHQERFEWPLGIAVDPEGNLYISDVMHCRVRRFSPDGELLTAFGQVGANVGSFVRPKHVAVDPEGRVFVVDAGFANVQIFDAEDQLLTYFGSAGGHPGAMQLPAGVCVHEGDLDLFESYIHPDFEAERLVLVTNQFGVHKVSVYAMGQLREGVTPQDLTGSVVPVGDGLIGEDEEAPTGVPEGPPPGAGASWEAEGSPEDSGVKP